MHARHQVIWAIYRSSRDLLCSCPFTLEAPIFVTVPICNASLKKKRRAKKVFRFTCSQKDMLAPLHTVRPYLFVTVPVCSASLGWEDCVLNEGVFAFQLQLQLSGTPDTASGCCGHGALCALAGAPLRGALLEQTPGVASICALLPCSHRLVSFFPLFLCLST